MLEWFKNHTSILLTVLVTVGFFIYAYGCEPKVESLNGQGYKVNRQELQLELDTIINTAKFRMADLDRQEQLRSLVLQNALLIVQGTPFNPVGLITAAAAIYGITQGGHNITKTVKKVRNKRKVSNGTT